MQVSSTVKFEKIEHYEWCVNTLILAEYYFFLFNDLASSVLISFCWQNDGLWHKLRKPAKITSQNWRHYVAKEFDENKNLVSRLDLPSFDFVENKLLSNF